MQLAVAAQPDLQLLSDTPGRRRWWVPAIQGRPRLAAAVRAALRREAGITSSEVNPVTGRVLLRWNPVTTEPSIDEVFARVLSTGPLNDDEWMTVEAQRKTDRKARGLIAKLFIGGGKLLIILGNRLVFGAITVTPLSGAIAVLALAGTVITGYDFLRALWRTATGQSKITTGTLIGAATLSSVALGENNTALIVLWLLNLGEYLEILTLRRTRRAISDLLSTGDREVWIVRGDVEVSIDVSHVQPGDVVAVREGRRIGVDGQIIRGAGTISEAPITGESMPVRRVTGDSVYAGTVLLAGKIEICVTGIGSDTVVGRLIQRVEEAQTLRPRIQTVGDAFARRVVPSSFAAAVLVFLVTGDPRRALTMLLVACPCAAGLATPTAVSASLGNAARRGILIKGGSHIEAMSELDTVCFDKTGTITESQPTVESIEAFEGYTERQVLELAARVEIHSQHPLALAVLDWSGQTDGGLDRGDEFEVIPGLGVRCWNADEEVLAGSDRLLVAFGLPAPTDYRNGAETLIYIAHNRKLVGLLTVSAKIRPEARTALASLRDAGIRRTVMLTGDSERVAEAVATLVGIDHWRSRLLPEHKFQSIREFQADGRKVAMVGDGINDAPALALADVGIAMGTAASDVAIETADVALASNDLHKMAATVRLSRRTMRVIRQNYGLALGTNSIGLYLGAMGSINPIIAAVLHNLSTLLVVLNSTRLIDFDPDLRQIPRNRTGSTACAPCSQHEEYNCPSCSQSGEAEEGKFQNQAA
jgi:manganese/zinc-transporting P-type ATPase C